MRFATRLGLAALAFVLAAGAASAQDKNVTFQVNMQPFIDVCAHDPDSNALEVRGDVFGWDDSAPDMTYDGDGTYSYTAQIAEGTAISYKFFSASGLEYEDNTDNRTYTVTGDADQTLDEVDFADDVPADACGVETEEQDYEVEFTVDMTVQVARGAFDPATQTPGIAGGITDWGNCAVALQPDGFEDNVFSARVDPMVSRNGVCSDTTLTVPGDQAYKFVILNNSDNSIAAWESGSDRIYSLTGDEPDADSDGALEASVPRRFFNDVDASQVLQDETTVTFRVDLSSAAFYLADNSSIPGTPEAITQIDGVWINGPAMWESTAGGGPGSGITDWLGWGTELAARDEFGFSDDDSDGVWELELTYPAGALTTLVGKLGINGADNEGGFGNDSFYPIANDTGVIDLVFGAMRKADGTFRDDCGPDTDDPDADCNPIYDPYILVDNTATPPTAMAVDGTGEFDVAIQGGPGIAEGIELSAPRPNPSAGQTTVVLTLDRGMDVRVQVIDLTGRTVATLTEGTLAAGETTLGLNASAMAAGVYVLRVEAGGEVVSRRMTVVR